MKLADAIRAATLSIVYLVPSAIVSAVSVPDTVIGPPFNPYPVFTCVTEPPPVPPEELITYGLARVPEPVMPTFVPGVMYPVMLVKNVLAGILRTALRVIVRMLSVETPLDTPLSIRPLLIIVRPLKVFVPVYV